MKRSPARVLRSKGLIPAEWNLRSLTSGQKSYITKQAKRYADVLKHPDRYVSRKVGKESADALKRAGYEVNRGKTLIYSKRDKVTISKGELTFQSKDGIRSRVLLMGRPDFLKRLERLRHTAPPPGTFYALKIGNSPRFHHIHPNLEDLIQYASEKHDMKDWHSADAEDHISLVIVDYRSGDSWDAAEDDDEK